MDRLKDQAPTNHPYLIPFSFKRWRSLARWAWKPGLPGLLALIEGVMLLGLFCFAPWFSWQANIDIPARISPQGDKYLIFIDSNHLSSGWATAQGVVIESFSIFHAVFVYLWLIPLSAVALLAFGGLCLRHRISARLAGVALLTCSALVLLVELILYVHVLSIQHTMVADFVNVGVSWGFWVAVGVTAAAIAAGFTLLKPAYHRLRARKTTESAAG